MITDLILGTAGHIDHGKTSLVGALTGTNTDRLPEEKKRGITIELGYAKLQIDEFRLGIVDVPGHEKFVRQMLAGATGIDLAMLVVAADDSIKQQTIEHMDILRMLDLPAGVIAVTKSDLVDPDWLELVVEEVRQFVKGSFLENAPIISTSANTGSGIEELKLALVEAAKIAAESDRQNRISAPFRMAIDRSFSIAGYGTVVTGSVSSGRIRVGETVAIEPGGTTARIRGIQTHDSDSDEVFRGQRGAINLSGVVHHSIVRGQEICSVGHLAPSRLMTISIRVLKSATRPLKDRARVRLHIGTAEILGNVRILDGDSIDAGQDGVAQIFLSQPAVAVWNQPFVIRSESPVETIGGGRVLHPNAARIKKPTDIDLEMIGQLSSTEETERASAAAYFSSAGEWEPRDLPRVAGVNDIPSIIEELTHRNLVSEINISPTLKIWVHQRSLENIGNQIKNVLKRLHEDHPLKLSHEISQLNKAFDYLKSRDVLKLAIKQLQSAREVSISNGSISLVGHGPKLSKNERALLTELVAEIKQGGVAPPERKALIAGAKRNKESVVQLLEMAAEGGDLVRLNADLFLHRETVDEIKERLRKELANGHGLTLSEIRQLLDTSRKFAIPLCEYLDQSGFTVRDGDLRRLG